MSTAAVATTAAAPPRQPGPAGPPGPLRAAVVLAQPAERRVHVRLPRRVHDHLRRAVRRRGGEARTSTGCRPCSTTSRRSPRCRCWAPATASSRSCWRPGGRTGSSSGSGPRRSRPGPTSSGCWRTASLVSVVDIVLIVGVGRMYGVPLPTHWAAIAVDAGARRGQLLRAGRRGGLADPNAEAAPAVAQLVLFPLLFMSGTYMPIQSPLLNRITGALPVRPFNEALTGPRSRAHRARLAAAGRPGWPGVRPAAFVAVRRFRWDPRPSSRRRAGPGPAAVAAARPGPPRRA